MKSLLKLFALAAMMTMTTSAMADEVNYELKPSKDLALRQGNSTQSGTGSTIEIRENSSNADALGYHFCGIMTFDIQDIATKVAQGYTVKDAKLFLTDCSNNTSSLLQVKPFPYNWEEDKTTTYDDMVDYVNEAIAANALATVQLKRYGGKKNFELQGASNHVYPFPLDAYQSYSENNAGLIAYITAAAENNDSEMGILIGRDTYSNQNCGIYTKDVDKINIDNEKKNCAQYAWNADTQKWEKVDGSDNTISRFEAALQFFCMTQADFAAAVCPRLYVTLEKEDSGQEEPQEEEADTYSIYTTWNDTQLYFNLPAEEGATPTLSATKSDVKLIKSGEKFIMANDDFYLAYKGSNNWDMIATADKTKAAALDVVVTDNIMTLNAEHGYLAINNRDAIAAGEPIYGDGNPNKHKTNFAHEWTIATKNGDVVTGIESIEHSTLNIEHSVYDMQGRRMESSMFNIQSSMLKKGLYIIGGKKVIR